MVWRFFIRVGFSSLRFNGYNLQCFIMVSPSLYHPYDSVVDLKKIDPLAYLCQNLISLSDPNVSLLNRIETQAERAQSTSGRHITLPDRPSDDIVRSLDTYVHPGDLLILRRMLYTADTAVGCRCRQDDDRNARSGLVDLSFYYGLREVAEGRIPQKR